MQRKLPVPGQSAKQPTKSHGLPVPGEEMPPPKKSKLSKPGDPSTSSTGFPEPKKPPDLAGTVGQAEKSGIVLPQDQAATVVKRPAAPKQRPAGSGRTPVGDDWNEKNLPPDFPLELLPRDAHHGKKSFTVTSKSGASIEVLSEKKAYFVKVSKKLKFGKHRHISWGTRGAQKTWKTLKSQLGW